MLLVKDGSFDVLTDKQSSQFTKHAFDERGRPNGVYLFRWPALGAQALEFFTAHGDGVYDVSVRATNGQAVWVDSGSILLMSADDERKVREQNGEPFKDYKELGTAYFKYAGTITAYKTGHVQGTNGLMIDTR
jgi:hypothetical protein